MGDDLTCPLCRKCSANKKAHIRHTSYCRKKAKRPPRPRRRSCLSCVKAKTHCDVATSSCCSRCSVKGIECKLEGSQPKEKPQDEASSQVDQLVMHQATHLPMFTDGDLSGAFPMPSTKDGVDRWLDHDPISDQWIKMIPYTLGPQLSLNPVKAFAPRRVTWGRFSLLGKYMVQTLRRYPYMMLSDKTCAPFIHRECMINSNLNTHKNGPGPLLRCTAIVELWQSKTPDNASALWKILRIEQERLMQEISEYEDLIAINALQAVTIYFLLRVSSTDDEHTDFDVPLIQTMTQLSLRVKGVITAYCDPASPTRSGICDWVKAESLRRTIATLFIIELLFDISPGMINRRSSSLALWSEMLLPCSQPLWEAKTEAEWTQRYDLLGDMRPYYGELLRQEFLDSDRSRLLDQWMGNVDDFGKLVINIASLAGVG